jgi:hypothetical protein
VSGAAATTAAYKPCGECGLCCKALAVPEIDKPAGRWCRHFKPGAGCAIHAVLPGSCRDFQCLWTAAEVLGEAWRPDRCKLVIWTDHAGRIVVDPDPAHPQAWRREPFYSQIKAWSARTGPDWHEVLIRVGERVIMVFPEAEIDLGSLQPGRRIDSGYRQESGRAAPYARFGELVSSGVRLNRKPAG